MFLDWASLEQKKSLDFRAKISDKNNHVAHFWTQI